MLGAKHGPHKSWVVPVERLGPDVVIEMTSESTRREDRVVKLALYRAGRLAMQTQDKAMAEKYLTQLAGLDFGYKDVAALLDKLQ